MGYEYDLIAGFARQHGLRLNIKVAENITRLMEMLLSGEADVAAYPITIDNKLKEQMLFAAMSGNRIWLSFSAPDMEIRF